MTAVAAPERPMRYEPPPPFPKALLLAMEDRGMSKRDLAKVVQVSVSDIDDWLAGRAVPQGKKWALLKGVLRKLKYVRLPGEQGVPAALTTRRQDEVRATEEDFNIRCEREELVRQGYAPDKPPTEWPKALKFARVMAGYTPQVVVGAISNHEHTITVETYRNWESGRSVPTLASYTRLLTLLDDLRAWIDEGLTGQPQCKDIAKPTGRPPGKPRLYSVPSSSPQPTATKPKLAPAAVTVVAAPSIAVANTADALASEILPSSAAMPMALAMAPPMAPPSSPAEPTVQECMAAYAKCLADETTFATEAERAGRLVDELLYKQMEIEEELRRKLEALKAQLAEAEAEAQRASAALTEVKARSQEANDRLREAVRRTTV